MYPRHSQMAVPERKERGTINIRKNDGWPCPKFGEKHLLYQEA